MFGWKIVPSHYASFLPLRVSPVQLEHCDIVVDQNRGKAIRPGVCSRSEEDNLCDAVLNGGLEGSVKGDDT